MSASRCINTASFAVPGPFEAPIEDAILTWDAANVPGSRLATSVTTTFETTVDNNDGINSIAAIDMIDLDPSNIAYFGCTTPALTDMNYTNQVFGIGANRILKADIMLDATDCVWDTDAFGEYYDVLDSWDFADRLDVEQIVLHEVGHAVGLEHEDGILDDDPWGVIVDYEGWPSTMASSNSGGSVYDTDYLERRYLANEDDREGVRTLYIPLSSADVDWAPQSYRVNEDDVILAAAGANCSTWMGQGISRPEPMVDLFAAAQDQGEAFGDCPRLDDWISNPVVAPPAPLELYNGTLLRVQFTLNNLGDGSGLVDWEVQFTDDPTAAACTGDCWVVASGSSNIGANTPYQREAIDIEVPDDAPVGTYYVRMVMDPADAYSEGDETNNVAIWNQQVAALGVVPCGCRTGSPSGAVGGLLLIAMGLTARRERRR